jgi:hypothetical protein
VQVLTAGTCSVATIKIPELVDKIRQEPGYQLKLVVTEHSRHFLPSLGRYGCRYYWTFFRFVVLNSLLWFLGIFR